MYDELDDLLRSYSFSAGFDGDTRQERRAIENYVSGLVLAERERCAKIRRDYQYEHRFVGERYALLIEADTQ